MCATGKRELAALRAKLAEFDSRLDGCVASLTEVNKQTKVLPHMYDVLQALVDAHATQPVAV